MKVREMEFHLRVRYITMASVKHHMNYGREKPMHIDWNKVCLVLALCAALLAGCQQIFSDPASSLADEMKTYVDQLSHSPSPQMTFHYSVKSAGLTTFLFLPNETVTTPELQRMKLPLIEKITVVLNPGEMIILQKNGTGYSHTTVQKNFVDPPDRILGASKTGGTLYITLQKSEASGKPKIVAVQ